MAGKRSARFPKGSPEAKAWGRKMAKARKECNTAYSKAAGGKKHPKKAKSEHKRKKPRTAAQKAATAKMLAANRKTHPKHKKAKHKSEHHSEHKTEHKRKKPRTVAQKAATARMVAANKRARRGEHHAEHKRSHPKKAKRQAAIRGAFRGGPRGGIVVSPHKGNARCSICGKRHGQREHYSHAHGPHNLRTGTEHSYKGLSTPETVAANPKAPLRVRAPKNIKEAAQIAALERKSGKRATFIGPREAPHVKRARKALRGLAGLSIF